MSQVGRRGVAESAVDSVVRFLFPTRSEPIVAEKKIIAVVGATGAQGGGVVRAVLADKNSEFAVRAITRDVNSEKAKALAAMGAEVVAGDIDDVESLTKAFA